MKATPLTVAAALVVAGLGVSYCFGRTSGAGQRALDVVDSVRIARAAANRAEAAAQSRFAGERDSMVRVLDAAKAAQPARIVRTVAATSNLDTTLQALARAADSLPGVRALVGTAQRQLDSLRAAQGAERAGAATSLAAAERVMHADTLELDRRARRIGELQQTVDRGLDREAKLARRLNRSWSLAWTVGPGVTFDGQVHGGITVTAGLSHQIRLPRII